MKEKGKAKATGGSRELVSDVISEDDDHRRADERKEEMGIRRNLKNVAATFVADKGPKKGLLGSETTESSNKKSDSKNDDFPAFKEKDIGTTEITRQAIDVRPNRSTAVSRATKIYQSFTAGLNRSSTDKTLFSGTNFGDLGRSSRRREDNERIDEDEKNKILKIIEQEESSDDDEDDTSSEEDGSREDDSSSSDPDNGKREKKRDGGRSAMDMDSLYSDNDILNRSL